MASEPGTTPDDPELDGIVRLAGRLCGSPAVLTLDAELPVGALLLRGTDGAVRGALSVPTAHLDEQQREVLHILSAQAGALLERRAREGDLLDAVGALLRTNDELAAFAGRVAHDLRAPLTAVLGFLALADGPFRDETSERAADCVHSALGAATRMRTLVDDLLAYATLTLRPRSSRVELPALVDAVSTDLGDRLRGVGGTVDYAGPDRVDSDATLLRQLVQNLVGNALTHGRPGVAPHVHVRAGTAGSTWWVEVSDNGPGIPAGQRERVFDPFVRLDTAKPGSGIGLATCARITEALGGRIMAEEAPGGGAALKAIFPVRG